MGARLHGRGRGRRPRSARYRHLRPRRYTGRSRDSHPSLQHGPLHQHTHVRVDCGHGNPARRRRSVGSGRVGSVLDAREHPRLRPEPIRRDGRRGQPAHDALRQRGAQEHGLLADVHRRPRRHHPSRDRQLRRRRRLLLVGSVCQLWAWSRRRQRWPAQHDADERVSSSVVLFVGTAHHEPAVAQHAPGAIGHVRVDGRWRDGGRVDPRPRLDPRRRRHRLPYLRRRDAHRYVQQPSRRRKSGVRASPLFDRHGVGLPRRDLHGGFGNARDHVTSSGHDASGYGRHVHVGCDGARSRQVDSRHRRDPGGDDLLLER